MLQRYELDQCSELCISLTIKKDVKVPAISTPYHIKQITWVTRSIWTKMENWLCLGSAIDGFSKKVVAHSTMPIKNNLAIYEDVFRPAVLTYGMWDQVRVDHGKEFYLMLFMQELLTSHRHNQERRPYLQTSSTRNHIVERKKRHERQPCEILCVQPDLPVVPNWSYKAGGVMECSPNSR